MALIAAVAVALMTLAKIQQIDLHRLRLHVGGVPSHKVAHDPAVLTQEGSVDGPGDAGAHSCGCGLIAAQDPSLLATGGPAGRGHPWTATRGSVGHTALAGGGSPLGRRA